MPKAPGVEIYSPDVLARLIYVSVNLVTNRTEGRVHVVMKKAETVEHAQAVRALIIQAVGGQALQKRKRSLAAETRKRCGHRHAGKQRLPEEFSVHEEEKLAIQE